MTEKRDAFDELQFHLRSAVPGFKGLNVKARGGPGEAGADPHDRKPLPRAGRDRPAWADYPDECLGAHHLGRRKGQSGDRRPLRPGFRQ